MTFPPRLWLVALAVLALDQASKWWALRELADGHRVSLLGDAFGLQLTRNPGAAFSLGDGFTPVITVVMIVVVVLLVRAAPRVASRPVAVLLAVAVGGALGNLTDRLLRAPGPMRGHVIDMIYYGDWFIGNVADIAIVGSAAVAVVMGLAGKAIFAPAPAQEPAVDSKVPESSSHE